MKRTFLTALFALLTLTAPARAATIQWDFFSVGDNPVVVGGIYPNNTFAKISVAGYFDYDTTTNALSTLLPNPFAYQVYENGTLALDCMGLACDLGISGGNTVTISSSVLPYFALAASNSFNGSSPVMPGSGFLAAIAPFGTNATGAFVEAQTIQPPPPQAYAPLPPALPLFGTALVGLGGVGWFRRKSGKVSA